MCFFFSLIPATFWAVIGFFVLFAFTKPEGGLRKFSQVLATCSFILAAVFPLGGAFVTLAGLCSMAAIVNLSAAGIGSSCGCGLG